MDIDRLSDYGVTILVRCKDYKGGHDLGWAKVADEAHLWTASCKPWDVVTVDTRTPVDTRLDNGFNKD